MKFFIRNLPLPFLFFLIFDFGIIGIPMTIKALYVEKETVLVCIALAFFIISTTLASVNIYRRRSEILN